MDGRVKKDVVRNCKKGQTASSGSREMQELTSAGRDGEILPRGTAVTKSPELRGGGPLHGTAFVRGSKGGRRVWSSMRGIPGRPMDQVGDAAVCAGDGRGCRGFEPGACPGDCQRPSVYVALDTSSAASRRLACIPFHPLCVRSVA